MEERVKAREKRLKSENSIVVLTNPKLTVQYICILQFTQESSTAKTN